MKEKTMLQVHIICIPTIQKEMYLQFDLIGSVNKTNSMLFDQI